MFTRTTRAKRNIATVALAALVGSLLALSTPASAAESARLSGANRYATAAAVAESSLWDNMTDVDLTIVNGENFPDGLAAAALGNRVLLVTADSVPAETEASIKKLESTIDVETITVVGGTGVVSSAVLEQLDALNGTTTDSEVVRVSGADRYETALEVAKVVNSTPADIVLATGANFPDALSAGPLALQESAPIVLNDGASLRADVKAYVALATGDIHVIGGEGAVPASVVSELQTMGKNVIRYAGANRDDTAAKIAAALGNNGNHSALLVNRDGFADALAAGPFAHQQDVEGSIMLTGVDSVPAETVAWHKASCITLGTTGTTTTGGADGAIYAMGGTAVVSDAVLTAAAGAADCAALTATATLDVTDQKSRVLEVLDAGGGTPTWVTTNAPVLTAVAGSAAAGVAGNGWTVAVAGNAALEASTATISGSTLTFTANASLTGMTQATFVDKWNSTAAASALFTASVATGVIPSVSEGTTTGATQLTAGSEDYTVVVTWSEPVGDFGTFTNAPGGANFAKFTGMTPAATVPTLQTPLENLPVTDGSTTFTFFWNDIATVGGTPLLTLASTFAPDDDEVKSFAGTGNASISVTLTAAS